MSDGLDFSVEDYNRMPMAERIRLCRRLAQRAEQLAAADPRRRDTYLQIAKGWIALAENMERHD
jgi:hypothetical protein